MRAAAFHEAGHAVAAYHLHVRLRRISIGADEGDALGWLDLWLPDVVYVDADDIRQAQAVERDVIVRLAGAQAERVALGRSSCPAGDVDFDEAMRRAGAICRSSEELSACLRCCAFGRTHWYGVSRGVTRSKHWLRVSWSATSCAHGRRAPSSAPRSPPYASQASANRRSGARDFRGG